MDKILVLGDDMRSFLAVVRSLGRRGYEVHAAPLDFSSPALTSRYISATHRVPRYAVSPEAWLAAVQRLIVTHGYALIVPCGDHHLLPLVAHRAALDAALAVPNQAALDVLFDKVKTRALAQHCGVPVAVGGAVSAARAAELGLPFALKPRASVTLGDVANRRTVKIIDSAQQVDAALDAAQPADEYFIEAFFAGEGVGVSVLADQGRIVEAFQHRRLAETSESGGSSRRISEALDREMGRAVTALCAAVALHGVAMFEFRHSPVTRAFVLLEVNARFWGSLPLAVASGVDFPADLADLLIGARAGAQPDYRLGVKRNHLSAEYYRVILNSEAAPSTAGRALRLAGGLARLTCEIAIAPSHFDSYAADDRAPWRAEVKRLTHHFTRAINTRLPVNAAARERHSAARLDALLAQAKGEPRILFVCLGNICRSPFAARALVARLSPAVDVRSAGTLHLANRPSPADALAAAPHFGVDLDDHRSCPLDDAMADSATVIFIFDDRNADDLAQRGCDAAKIIRLGDLVGLRAVEDPYSHGPAAFDACFRQIVAAVDRVAEAILRR